MFVCPVYVEFTFCLAKYGVLLTSNLCLGTEISPGSSAGSSTSGSVDEAEQGGGRGIGGWLAGIAKVPFRVRLRLESGPDAKEDGLLPSCPSPSRRRCR